MHNLKSFDLVNSLITIGIPNFEFANEFAKKRKLNWNTPKTPDMILYNVTFNVANDIEEDFVLWMKETHIPDIFATGLFTGHHFYRLLNATDDSSTNYSVQFLAESTAKLIEYENRFANELRYETQARYGEKALAFRTILESVD